MHGQTRHRAMASTRLLGVGQTVGSAATTSRLHGTLLSSASDIRRPAVVVLGATTSRT